VSFLSAITLLGTPSAIYLFGTMYFYQGKKSHRLSLFGRREDIIVGISVVIASIVAALVFMPKFREMNFTSTYEVFSLVIFFERHVHIS
jgi:hypothetical protein